jgi:K+-transporting ATPase KdpF subunit
VTILRAATVSVQEHKRRPSRTSRGDVMHLEYVATGVVALLIAVYLFAALLWPERF